MLDLCSCKASLSHCAMGRQSHVSSAISLAVRFLASSPYYLDHVLSVYHVLINTLERRLPIFKKKMPHSFIKVEVLKHLQATLIAAIKDGYCFYCKVIFENNHMIMKCIINDKTANIC